jgi:ribose-phosphate pyrophosphokinase
MQAELNLVNESNTDIKFKISKFPDGQQGFTVLNPSVAIKSSDVVIKSRLNDFKDLEIIIEATSCLREIGVKSISLYIPYFLGGRSDRKFEAGGTNYIKTVIAPIINLQGYTKVTVIDPHSDVIEACIQNFAKQDNIELVKFALNDFKSDKKIVLVSPDAGALKKVFNVVEKISPEFIGGFPVIIGNKHRDLKGKITHTSVPECEKYVNHDYFIIDDICDGGRTFIEVAKVIQGQIDLNNGKGQLYLVITHGIFSSGLEELKKYFQKIWTTNSIKNINNELVKQMDVF